MMDDDAMMDDDPFEDARIEELDAIPVAPKKKRKSSTSPNARTLAECRKRGWIAQTVERPWNPHTKVTLDLFGVIDIVAIEPPNDEILGGPRIIGIQACSGGRSGADGRGSDHAARRAKILAEPRAKQWVEAGGRLELWSWSKRGAAGSRKLWTLRVEVFTVEEWRTA